MQLKLDKAQSDAKEENLNDKDDFREMDSMEGGLVDVRNQVEIAAEVIKVEFAKCVCNIYYDFRIICTESKRSKIIQNSHKFSITRVAKIVLHIFTKS